MTTAMAESFDPYYKWLAIPPDEQPPHYYRLLGVQRFETDPDVIATAADQRMAHLRTYQTGKHSALSQRLLNEISAARVCLLNPAKKTAYDQQLRASLQPPSPAAPPMAPVAPPELPLAPPPPKEPPRPSAARPTGPAWPVPVGLPIEQAALASADSAEPSVMGLEAEPLLRKVPGGRRGYKKKQSSLAVLLPIAVIGALAAAGLLVYSKSDPAPPVKPIAAPAAQKRKHARRATFRRTVMNRMRSRSRRSRSPRNRPAAGAMNPKSRKRRPAPSPSGRRPRRHQATYGSRPRRNNCSGESPRMLPREPSNKANRPARAKPGRSKRFRPAASCWWV